MQKVLIVDDDNEFQRMVGMTLKSEEYVLLFAQDGMEALKTARKEIPDVMVCDVMMPSLDGIELTRLLKADERTRHIHIILLTASADSEDVERGLLAGAGDYFVKPFSPLNLLDRIYAVLTEKSRT
ncbi:MAG: PleD family two-component system response regulator [Candidatus Xenobiia bacterium LiM19]